MYGVAIFHEESPLEGERLVDQGVSLMPYGFERTAETAGEGEPDPRIAGSESPGNRSVAI